MKPISILGTALFVIIAVIMTVNSMTRTANVVSPVLAFTAAEIELCAAFETSSNGVEPEIECDEISTAHHHRAHPIPIIWHASSVNDRKPSACIASVKAPNLVVHIVICWTKLT